MTLCTLWQSSQLKHRWTYKVSTNNVNTQIELKLGEHKQCEHTNWTLARWTHILNTNKVNTQSESKQWWTHKLNTRKSEITTWTVNTRRGEHPNEHKQVEHTNWTQSKWTQAKVKKPGKHTQARWYLCPPINLQLLLQTVVRMKMPITMMMRILILSSWRWLKLVKFSATMPFPKYSEQELCKLVHFCTKEVLAPLWELREMLLCY